MKKIQILGPGCPNCSRLATVVENATRRLGIECEIEKISDIEKIMEAGVMKPPAMVVDGKVLVSGRVPSGEEIERLLVGGMT